VDPKSSLGEEAAAFLIKAYDVERDNPDGLIAVLERYIQERGSHVQIGSADIPSSGG